MKYFITILILVLALPCVGNDKTGGVWTTGNWAVTSSPPLIFNLEDIMKRFTSPSVYGFICYPPESGVKISVPKGIKIEILIPKSWEAKVTIKETD